MDDSIRKLVYRYSIPDHNFSINLLTYLLTWDAATTASAVSQEKVKPISGCPRLTSLLSFSSMFTRVSAAADRPARRRGLAHAKYSISHHMVNNFLYSA